MTTLNNCRPCGSHGVRKAMWAPTSTPSPKRILAGPTEVRSQTGNGARGTSQRLCAPFSKAGHHNKTLEMMVLSSLLFRLAEIWAHACASCMGLMFGWIALAQNRSPLLALLLSMDTRSWRRRATEATGLTFHTCPKGTIWIIFFLNSKQIWWISPGFNISWTRWTIRFKSARTGLERPVE